MQFVEAPYQDDLIVTVGRFEQLMATLGEVENTTIWLLKRSTKQLGTTAEAIEAEIADLVHRRVGVTDEILRLAKAHRRELFDGDTHTLYTRGGTISLRRGTLILVVSRTGTKIRKETRLS